MITAAENMRPFDAPLMGDQAVHETYEDPGPRVLSDLIAGDDDPEQNLMAVQLQQSIRNGLKRLKKREQKVLAMRFGIGLRNEETGHQVADLLGVSRERVYQIERKAITKLRKYIGKDLLIQDGRALRAKANSINLRLCQKTVDLLQHSTGFFEKFVLFQDHDIYKSDLTVADIHSGTHVGVLTIRYEYQKDRFDISIREINRRLDSPMEYLRDLMVSVSSDPGVRWVINVNSGTSGKCEE